MLAAVEDDSEDTTPSEKRVRAPLRNVHEVRAELCKIYREARGQKLSVDHASKFCFILTQIAKVMETSELTKRIEALEGAK